jgi:hypothetical protein
VIERVLSGSAAWIRRAGVDERSNVLVATLLGAVVGGLWGYLYLTSSGRRVRDDLEPRIDAFVNEVRRMKRTVEKARAAADESWHALDELSGGQSHRRETRGGMVS